MEVKGDEFIKNLEIEKEKIRLQKESDMLNAQKKQTIFKTPLSQAKDDELLQELDDIKLKTNDNNKQKYIMFGFALILLFLVTIITIKLLQEPKQNDDFAPTKIEADEDVNKLKTTTKKIDKSFDIDKISQAEEKIKQPKPTITEEKAEPTTGDVFGIENPSSTPKTNNTPTEPEILKPKITKKQPVKQTTKKIIPHRKKIEKAPIKEIDFTTEPTVVTKHWYIQVGAFTKQPDKRLLYKLKRSKYPFIMKKMTIKNRLYTKLLVGGYSSKAQAQKDLTKVRQIANNPGSYILRIK